MLAPSSAHPKLLASCCLDERGSVSAEYALLLCLVVVVGSLALVAAGVPLAQTFMLRETWLLLPFP